MVSMGEIIANRPISALFNLFTFGCFVYILVRISQVKNNRRNNDLVEETGSLVDMSTWKKTHDKVFLFFFWWFIAVMSFLLLLMIVAFGIYGAMLKDSFKKASK
jgi:hypothetical protein